METGEAVARTGERAATGQKRRSCFTRGKPWEAVEQKGGPGGEASWQVLKWQAGNFDPGMEASERGQPLRARERPLRVAGPEWKKAAASQEASIRLLGKPAVGEPSGEASGASSCDVQCRVCRR